MCYRKEYFASFLMKVTTYELLILFKNNNLYRIGRYCTERQAVKDLQDALCAYSGRSIKVDSLNFNKMKVRGVGTVFVIVDTVADTVAAHITDDYNKGKDEVDVGENQMSIFDVL